MTDMRTCGWATPGDSPTLVIICALRSIPRKKDMSPSLPQNFSGFSAWRNGVTVTDNVNVHVSKGIVFSRYSSMIIVRASEARRPTRREKSMVVLEARKWQLLVVKRPADERRERPMVSETRRHYTFSRKARGHHCGAKPIRGLGRGAESGDGSHPKCMTAQPLQETWGRPLRVLKNNDDHPSCRIEIV